MPILRRAMLAGAVLQLLLPALLACPALADAPYLTAKQLDLTLLLPPPPAAGSELQAAELRAVIAVQKAATPERVAQAQADARETVFDMFTPTLGDRFVAGNLPKTAAFFARIGDTEDAVADPAKKVFGRVRPYLASSDVKGIPPTSSSGSWPSGHTTRVTIAAVILSAVFPEQRTALWARAADYARSRIVLGMHYPLDLVMGGRAGTAIAAVLFTQPGFVTDFEAVKTELRAWSGR